MSNVSLELSQHLKTYQNKFKELGYELALVDNIDLAIIRNNEVVYFVNNVSGDEVGTYKHTGDFLNDGQYTGRWETSKEVLYKTADLYHNTPEENLLITQSLIHQSLDFLLNLLNEK